ncbi:Receptor-like protein EIX2 [Linum grandiflorum]
MINTVPNLSRLYLSDCQISDDFPLIHVNLSSLSVLDLSYNRFGPSSFPSWVSHLKSLTSLALRGNLRGAVPDELRNLTSLRALKLSENKFNGTIPNWLFGFRHLQDLDFHSSNLVGDVSNEIGNMTSLVNLDLSFNYGLKLEGGIPASFRSFCHLSSLKLSYVKLQQSVSEVLEILEECSSGTNLMEGVVSEIHFANLKKLNDFRAAGNKIVFKAKPDWVPPKVLEDIVSLDMSNTGISESIPDWFWSMDSPYYYLNFSHNQIPGRLPNTMFDLSWNHLEGPLPVISSNRTWGKLKVVRLGRNKLRGSIPSSIGTLTSLLSLRIQNNSLTGEIPLSLGNCTSIVSIDLGDNKLEGNIPKWIGERLSRLAILNLRGNKFMGYVPEKLCHLQLLQILNLSHNYLFGNLPECVANFSAMGRVKSYSTILNYVRSLDLSCNNFSGEIPKQITSLVALHYLNLSHNSLSGSIPENIDAMESLESLDISQNQLSGVIPAGMASLTFLNHLNLSYNNLSGRIPSSTQLQSFDPSSFIGNKGLCGSPLNVSCSRLNLVPGSGEGNGDYDMQWFSVSIMFGFAFGFWGTVGSIEVCQRWREFCFGVLDKVWSFVMSGSRLLS